jgi:prophage regulatory protein
VAPTNKKSINELLGLNVDDAFLGSCITDACLRIDTVLEITGLSRPTLYREISQGRFPRPIKITDRACPWRLSQIVEWVNTRERDAGLAAARVGIEAT